MDFRNLKRKDLQALCKKHNIPANLSNLEMANRITELLKEGDPLIQRSLRGQDDNVIDTASVDVIVNTKVKKVRFSPEHELIEFTRSPEMRRGSRRNTFLCKSSSLSVENVRSSETNKENSGDLGRVLRSKGFKLMEDKVNKKNRGKIPEKIDNGKLKEGEADSSGQFELGEKMLGEGKKFISKLKKRTIDDGKEDEKSSGSVGSEKLIGQIVDNPGRVTRSRLQKLTDISAIDEKRGRKTVKIIQNVAPVMAEKEENKETGSFTNRADVVEGKLAPNAGEREKRKRKGQEVDLMNKIEEEREVAEPKMLLRRSKRTMNSVVDSEILNVDNGGTENGVVNTSRKVSLKLEESIKVEPRRSTRRKIAIEADVQKAVSSRNSVQQIGTAGEASKDEKNDIQPTGVMGRSRRKTTVAENLDFVTQNRRVLRRSVPQLEEVSEVPEEEKKVLQPTGVAGRSRRKALSVKPVSVDEETVNQTENRRVLRGSVPQLEIAGEVPENEKKVLPPAGVTRRSKRKTLSGKLVSADEEIDAHSARNILETETQKKSVLIGPVSQIGITGEVSKDEKKVLQPTDVTRSSRRKSVCVKLVDEAIDVNFALGNLEAEKPENETTLMEKECSAVQKNTRRSRRITSECKSQGEIGEDSIIHQKSRIPISGGDAMKTNNDINSVAETKKETSNKKVGRGASTGKVSDSIKRTRLNDFKVLDASPHNSLGSGELFPTKAQASLSEGLGSTSNLGFSADTVAKSTHGKEPGISTENTDPEVEEAGEDKHIQQCPVGSDHEVESISDLKNLESEEAKQVNDMRSPVSRHGTDLDHLESSDNIVDNIDKDTIPKSGAVEYCERSTDYTRSRSMRKLKVPSSCVLRSIEVDHMTEEKEAFFQIASSELDETDEGGSLEIHESVSYSYSELSKPDLSDGNRSAGIAPPDNLIFAGEYSVISSDKQEKYKDPLVISSIAIGTDNSQINLMRGSEVDHIPELCNVKSLNSDDGNTVNDGSYHKSKREEDEEFSVSNLFEAEASPEIMPQDNKSSNSDDGNIINDESYKCKRDEDGEFRVSNLFEAEEISPEIMPQDDKSSNSDDGNTINDESYHKSKRDEDGEFCLSNLLKAEVSPEIMPQDDKSSNSDDGITINDESYLKSKREEEMEFSVSNLFKAEVSPEIMPQDFKSSNSEDDTRMDVESNYKSKCDEDGEFNVSNLFEAVESPVIISHDKETISGEYSFKDFDEQGMFHGSPLVAPTIMHDHAKNHEVDLVAEAYEANVFKEKQSETFNDVREGLEGNERSKYEDWEFTISNLFDSERSPGTTSQDKGIDSLGYSTKEFSKEATIPDFSAISTTCANYNDVKFSLDSSNLQETNASQSTGVSECPEQPQSPSTETMAVANTNEMPETCCNASARAGHAISQILENSDTDNDANDADCGKLRKDCSIIKLGVGDLTDEKCQDTEETEDQDKNLLETQTQPVVGGEPTDMGSIQTWAEIELHNLFETTFDDDIPPPHDTSSSGTEAAILISAKKNLGSFTKEGETSGCEKSTDKNVVLPTSSSDTSHAGFDVEMEENKLATPIKIDGTWSHGRELESGSMSVLKCSNPMKDNVETERKPDEKDHHAGFDLKNNFYLACPLSEKGAEVTRDGLGEVESVEMVNISATVLSVSEFGGCVASEEQLSEYKSEFLKETNLKTEENKEEKAIPLQASCNNEAPFNDGESTQKNSTSSPDSPRNLVTLEGYQDLFADTVLSESLRCKDFTQGGEVEYDLSEADLQRFNLLERNSHSTAHSKDNILREKSVEPSRGPLDAQVEVTSSFDDQQNVLDKGTSPSCCSRYPESDALAEKIDSTRVDKDLCVPQILDVKDDNSSRSSQDISDDNLEGEREENSKEVEEGLTASMAQFLIPPINFEEKMEDFNSDVPSSGCTETLKESDVAATIKEYIDSESSLSMISENSNASLPMDELAQSDEWTTQENAVLSENTEDVGERFNITEEEVDKTQNKELEEATLFVEPAQVSVKEVNSPVCVDFLSEVSSTEPLVKKKGFDVKLDSQKQIEAEDDRKSPPKNLYSTAKKNARTVLIHGTPGKLQTMADMKENAPAHKRSNIGDVTAVRPAKRRALQDVKWK